MFNLHVHFLIVIILLLSACGDGGSDNAGNASLLTEEKPGLDTPLPDIEDNKQLIPIITTTEEPKLGQSGLDTVFKFNSNLKGDIAYIGQCKGSDDKAIKGENVITITSLDQGSFETCGLFVIDDSGNESSVLSIKPLSIIDTVSTIPEIEVIDGLSSHWPTIHFYSDKPGILLADQDCNGQKLSFIAGENSLTLDLPGDNSRITCGIKFTDAEGNYKIEWGITTNSIDAISPELEETAAVSVIENSQSASYSFMSTEPGTLIFSGGCHSKQSSAIKGENTILLEDLQYGEYNNCRLSLRDSAGNNSNELLLSAFVIVDTVAPVIAFINSSGLNYSHTPSLIFSSDEAGEIQYSGSCVSPLLQAKIGTNTIQFNHLDFGYIEDCSIHVVDTAGYVSNTLVVAPFSVPMYYSAWVGESDTLIDFPSSAQSYTFYRSTESQCDISNYAACTNGQSEVISDVTITDTALNLYRDAYYSFDFMNQSSLDNYVSRKNFTSRANHQLLSFQDKIWIIGGKTAYANQHHLDNDIWYSKTGEHWTQAAAQTRFSGREEHQAIVFNNQMWVIAGNSDAGLKNDVWASSDGLSWGLKTDSAPFSPRRNHQLAVFNNRLWLIGGIDQQGAKSDIWSTVDGIEWQQETAAANFLERSSHQVFVFNNQLWLIGGRVENTADALQVEVWSSDNGRDWSLINDNVFQGYGSTGQLEGHRAFEYDGKLWLLGGVQAQKSGNTTYISRNTRIWSSTDGLNWTVEGRSSDYAEHFRNFEIINFQNSMWTIGGNNNSYANPHNSLWFSKDIVNWKRPIWDSKRFSGRLRHQVATLNNQLFVVSGENQLNNSINDAWSSSDGVIWNELTSDAPFAREDHQLVNFKDKLWLIGGSDSSSYKSKNDVWSSADGITWNLEIAEAAFSGRREHQVKVFADKLWLIGGRDVDGINQNDVWSSVDGKTWILELEHAPFAGRHQHQVVVHDAKLWVIGGFIYPGSGISKEIYNDVWSSVDGVNWIEESSYVSLLRREFFRIISFDNKLWLFGGLDGPSHKNDIWTSTDGTNWQQRVTDAVFPQRFAPALTTFDNRIWLIGGARFGHKNDVWSSDDGLQWRRADIQRIDYSSSIQNN